MSHILVIVGSVRQDRAGRKVADWYLEQARQLAPDHMDFELFDLADQKLDVFDEPLAPMMGQYSETQTRLAEHVGNADGFIFVAGEYNVSVPGALKNFIDYLFAEWNHKPVAYVGYGIFGAVRSVAQLVQVMSSVRAASIFDNIHVNVLRVDELADNPNADFVFGDIASQLQEFDWWVNALKAARA